MTPDLIVAPAADPRTEPPLRGDERTTLAGFLLWQRQTFALKCAGLDAASMARRAVEPSALSLLGLLRHLADVERSWFRHVLSGEERTFHHRTPEDKEAAFRGATADDAVVAAAWRAWREEVTFAQRLVDRAPDLDVTGREQWRGSISLRWVLVHLIEEYARHNGHADLLREAIDGRTGE